VYVHVHVRVHVLYVQCTPVHVRTPKRGKPYIKDVIAIPLHSKTISEASKIIQFVSNHHIVNAKFEEKRKEAGVTRKLSTSVPTRWYTEYTSAKNLFEAKVVLRRLAHEDSEELEKIQPKTKSFKALSLMKCEEFWDRLESLVKDLEFPSKVIGELLHNFWFSSIINEQF
jgi:spermidine/putrescine-binding protein